MKQTRLIMGMPVTVELVDVASNDSAADEKNLAAVFDYFTYIDEKFSTYKPESEMMRINRGELDERDWSDDMRIIFMLADETKRQTDGFFDIQRPDGSIDPSGIVKGWAIWQVAKILDGRGLKNYYVDAGGDIQTSGTTIDEATSKRTPWSIGIKNPLQQDEIVKTIYAPGTSAGGADGFGVATSGTYIRGEHIYNPKTGAPANEILSLTVIGPNIYEADRFATAAFAMGGRGIHFIESLPKSARLEGYMIDKNGVATMTTGFKQFTIF